MKKVTKKELVEKANEQELRIFRIEQALKKSDIDLESLVGKNKFVCVESTNEDIQVGTFGSVTGFDERFHTNFSIDGRNWEYIADVDGNHLTIDAGDAWKAKFKRVDNPFADVKPEPKLKQLDQSIFNGLDKKWRFAMVSSVGIPFVYDYKPTGKKAFLSDPNAQLMVNLGKVMRIDEYDYDASDWQNSLIERKELTGSDLCRAMLARGDKAVLCAVGTPDSVNDGSYYRAITEWSVAKLSFSDDSRELKIKDVTPINNQGEPLTQSDVGL